MSQTRSDPERGYGLIYVVLALFVLATLGIATLASYTGNLSPRTSDANLTVRDVYFAITGLPNTENFGYLGDVGDYPSSLQDLIVAPAGVSGWNGPYLTNVRADSSTLLDVYGSPLQYFLSLAAGSTDQLAIVSAGPDRSSSNTSGNTKTSASPFPGTAAYTNVSTNSDNVIFPDFVTDTNSVKRENAGTITYNISNFDYNASSNTTVSGCPGLYTLSVGSASRPTDTMNLQYSPGLTTQVGQGNYIVGIKSLQGVFPSVVEQLAIAAGSTLVRNILMPGIDSSGTPTFTLTVFNDTSPGNAISIQKFGSVLGSVTTGSPNGPSRTFTVAACSQMAAQIGGTTVDTWTMPYGNYTRYIQNTSQSTWSFTISNGGTQSDQLLVSQGTGLLLGTAYKRKTVTLNVPQNPGNNGLAAGVSVSIFKKDGVTLATGITNPVTITASGSTISVP